MDCEALHPNLPHATSTIHFRTILGKILAQSLDSVSQASVPNTTRLIKSKIFMPIAINPTRPKARRTISCKARSLPFLKAVCPTRQRGPAAATGVVASNISNLPVKDTFLFIDALDEIPRSEREDVLCFLQDLGSLRLPHLHVLVGVTAYHGDILESIRGCASLRVSKKKSDVSQFRIQNYHPRNTTLRNSRIGTQRSMRHTINIRSWSC